MKWYLLQRQKQHGQPYTINLDEEEVIIGRQASSYLSTFPQISRKHACFQQTHDGKWYIKDLGSLNGTFVNGVRIGKGLHPVNLGDIIGLGVPDLAEIEGFVCILCVWPVFSNIKQERNVDVSEGDFKTPFNSIKLNVEEISNISSKTKSFKSPNQESDSVLFNGASTSNVQDAHIQIVQDKPEQQNSFKNYYQNEDTMINNNSNKLYSSKRLQINSRNIHEAKRGSFNSVEDSVEEDVHGILRKDHLTISSKSSRAAVKIESNINSIQVKDCSIKLIRCDSPNFSSPYDINKTFNEDSTKKNFVPRKKRKRLRIISSSEESDCNNNVEEVNSSILSKKAIASQQLKSYQEKTNILEHRSSEKNIFETFKPLYLASCIKREVEHGDLSSSKKLAIQGTVKPIVQSESHDELGFSQKEEVITISDDDDYLDFNSSQLPLVNIKTEYCDDSDNSCIEHYDKIESSKGMKNECLHLNDKSENELKKSIILYADSVSENEANYYSSIDKKNERTSEFISKNESSRSILSHENEIEHERNETSKTLERNLDIKVRKSINEQKCVKFQTKFWDDDDDDDDDDVQDEIKNQDLIKAKEKKLKTSVTTQQEPEKNKSKRINLVNEISYSQNNIEVDEEEFLNATKPRTVKNATVEGESSKTLAFDYFPILSQTFDEDFDNSEEEQPVKLIYPSKSALKEPEFNSGNVSDSSSDTDAADKVKTNFLHNSGKPKIKTSGRTLLTEAKPMPYRPRTKRGREEWFAEKDVPEKEEESYRSSRPIHNKKRNSTIKPEFAEALEKLRKTKNKNKKFNKKNNLKEVVKKQVGYRIPFLKKGAAPIIKTTPEPVLNKVVQNEKKLNFSVSHTISARRKSDNENATKTKAPVKRRPENFGSRMTFLLEEDESNKKFIQTKGEGSKSLRNQEKTKGDDSLSSRNQEKNKHYDSKSLRNQSKVFPKVPSENKETFNKNYKAASMEKSALSNSSSNLSKKDQSASSMVNKTNLNHPVVHSESLYYPNKLPYVKNNEISSNYALFQHSSTLHTINKPIAAAHNVQFASTSHVSNSGTIRDPRLRGKQNNSVTGISLNNKPQAAVPPVVSKDCYTKLSFKMNFDYMLTKIVFWNTIWLKEQMKQTKPPPQVAKGIAKLSLSYDSLDKYAKAFFSMMLLEVWEMLFQDYKSICDDGKPVRNRFYFIASSCSSSGELMEVSCESPVNRHISYNPREGEIAMVELREKNTKQIIVVFGYIKRARTERLHDLTKFQRVPEQWLENAEMCKFLFLMKKKSIVIDTGYLTKAHVLSYVKNKLRLADGIQYLTHCSLTQDILHPRESTFKICTPIREKTHLLSSYNSSQTDIILSINEEMVKYISKPKVIMIQGPPGTGKTHTIVGILQHLLLNKRLKMKILVTAPSNAAVDVIGRRLVRLKNSRELLDAKFVRIGVSKQFHPEMRPYSLDQLALDAHENKNKNHNKNNELSSLKVQIDKLKREISRLAYAQESERKAKEYTLKQCEKHYSALKKYLEENQQDSKMCYVEEKNYKINILRDADIILSTLSSCRQSFLETIYGKDDLKFSCCIIDEATQCTETDILQPLMFGVQKLILVGDHQQLPATVNSQLAAECYFDRSIYERFHLYFMKHCNRSPIHKLTEQFRMHSEICSFPSQHFYDNMLSTFPGTDIKYESFPLKPYAVFDVLCGQESNARSSKTNVSEALVITEICKHFLDCIPQNCTVGIITPYQGQRDLYTRALSQNKNYQQIEVNTVDGFQGREKDVIILSCVRANSPSGNIGFLACKKRLNVAITRAKQCLIICGHMKSLQNDSAWAALIDNARNRNVYMSVFTPNDVKFHMRNISKNV